MSDTTTYVICIEEDDAADREQIEAWLDKLCKNIVDLGNDLSALWEMDIPCTHPDSSVRPFAGNPRSQKFFCDCGVEVQGDGPDYQGRETWTVKT